MRNSVAVGGLIGRREPRLYHLELVYNDVLFAEDANMYSVGDAAGWKMRTAVVNKYLYSCDSVKFWRYDTCFLGGVYLKKTLSL